MSEESEKTAGILAKIKAKQWKEMGKAVTQMKEFAEADVISSFLDNLKTTVTLELGYYFSDLNNEINAAVSDALEPIMPEIILVLGGLTDFVKFEAATWKGIITGEWDELFKFMSEKMSDDMKTLKNNIRQFFDDMFSGKMGRELMTGWEGFWTDVGAGWEGFWRDTGLF